MNHVPVTGSAGFLVSHMCDRFIERGNDVLGVVIFFTGSTPNVAHLLDRPNFELMRHDVTFPCRGTTHGSDSPTSLAAKELGWSPMVEPKDGLRESITYFRRILDL